MSNRNTIWFFDPALSNGKLKGSTIIYQKDSVVHRLETMQEAVSKFEPEQSQAVDIISQSGLANLLFLRIGEIEVGVSIGAYQDIVAFSSRKYQPAGSRITQMATDAGRAVGKAVGNLKRCCGG